MKIRSLRLLALFCFTLALLAVTACSALAQAAGDVGATLPSAGSFIGDLAAKNPWLVTVLAVIGGLRVLFKPIMLAIDYFVKTTPSTKDDDLVAKFETSAAAKWLAIGLDFVSSIKLPAANEPITKV